MNLITSMDSFGKQYQFNVDGGTFKTLLGGLLSIIMTLSTFGLFFYFGSDLYYKDSPWVIEKMDYLDYPPLIQNHNISNTFVSFRMIGPAYDNVRFFEHLVVYYYEYIDDKGVKQAKQTSGLTHKCTTDDIDIDTLTRNSLDGYYCIDHPDTTFGGFDINGEFHSPSLIVKFCDRDTEKRYNITCATLDERKKAIQTFKGKVFLNIVYQGNLVHHTNLTYPYRRKYYTSQIGLDLVDTEKAIYQNIFYRNAYIVTDTGVLFDDKYTTYFMEFDSISMDLEPPSGKFFGIN